MDVVKAIKSVLCKEGVLLKLSEDDIAKLHSIQLDMLHDFVDFCESRGLTYYLTGGSALGAVRHKGFIPWDDDIDIVVPRADYDLIKKDFPLVFSEKYYVEAPNTDNVGYLQLMKIKKKGTVLRELMALGPEYGVFIDVFPLEYAPNSSIHRMLCEIGYYILKSFPYSVVFSKLYKSVFKVYEEKFSIRLKMAVQVKRAWGKILSVVSIDKWLNSFDRMVQKKASDYYVVPSGIHRYKDECFPIDCFYPPRKAIFEDIEVNIPNKVDCLLTRFYGDYMIPPLEKSKYAHYFLAINLEN